jgi:enamine deaminase RidA (YjgF/YER057c/UK114 family)
MTIKRQEFGMRANKVVIHNDTVYLAGMIAEEPFLSVSEQMRRVLEQMDKRLDSAGSHKSKLIMINIYLSDMRRFGEMNEVWDAWLDKENAPARACVQAGMARPGYEIEITAIAAL